MKRSQVSVNKEQHLTIKSIAVKDGRLVSYFYDMILQLGIDAYKDSLKELEKAYISHVGHGVVDKHPNGVPKLDREGCELDDNGFRLDGSDFLPHVSGRPPKLKAGCGEYIGIAKNNR